MTPDLKKKRAGMRVEHEFTVRKSDGVRVDHEKRPMG